MAAPISGWDCPLLTFIYPGVDCGSFASRARQVQCQQVGHPSEAAQVPKLEHTDFDV